MKPILALCVILLLASVALAQSPNDPRLQMYYQAQRNWQETQQYDQGYNVYDRHGNKVYTVRPRFQQGYNYLGRGEPPPPGYLGRRPEELKSIPWNKP